MAYVPRFGRRLLSNWNYSSQQTVPPFLSQRRLAVQSTAFLGLSTSSRVLFYQILRPVLAYAHLQGVRLLMYLDNWLLDPDSRQEAHEQTSWLRSLCRRLGLVIDLEK